MGAVLELLLGILVVIVLTVLTGYFVAQDVGYLAVDRSGSPPWPGATTRAAVTAERTSFMRSGAQLGGTVTGCLADPLIGRAIGVLLGVAGTPAGIGAAVGTVLAPRPGVEPSDGGDGRPPGAPPPAGEVATGVRPTATR